MAALRASPPHLTPFLTVDRGVSMQDRALTPSEVAKRLGISRQQVYYSKEYFAKGNAYCGRT